MSKRFIPKDFWAPNHLFNLLHTIPGAIEELDVDNTSEFLAESTFLNAWNEGMDRAPELEGLKEYCAERGDEGEIIVSVVYDYNGAGEVNIVYNPVVNCPGEYDVKIFCDANLQYHRLPRQDEKTEWQLNCMANDIVDEDGRFIFEGEPCNE